MKQVVDKQFLAWLESEYAMPFSGWDFSYLQDRRIPQGQLSWDYEQVVQPYMNMATALLDIDTGGGEQLSRLLQRAHFQGQTKAVEPYAANVAVANSNLQRHKVQVFDTSREPADFTDDSFDLVISRHGGSVSPAEIRRILRPGGYFVTEQIGDQTNRELRLLFGATQTLEPSWPHNADDARLVFAEPGFAVEQLRDCSFPIRFVDVGALVYYLKAVPWEVPGFCIAEQQHALLDLHQHCQQNGYAIDTTYHAYLLVVRKLR